MFTPAYIRDYCAEPCRHLGRFQYGAQVAGFLAETLEDTLAVLYEAQLQSPPRGEQRAAPRGGKIRDHSALSTKCPANLQALTGLAKGTAGRACSVFFTRVRRVRRELH